jgi:Domain of unknown function (DUF4280)
VALNTCTKAQIQCNMGVAPSAFLPTPKMVFTSNMFAANIGDHVPFMNILPFGMCNSKTNPAVIAATAAALGTPTPAPCTPATPTPWAPGSPTVKLCGMPALNDSSKLVCVLGGSISFMDAGQTSHNIP